MCTAALRWCPHWWGANNGELSGTSQVNCLWPAFHLCCSGALIALVVGACMDGSQQWHKQCLHRWPSVLLLVPCIECMGLQAITESPQSATQAPAMAMLTVCAVR